MKWPVKKLGDVANICSGGTPDRSNKSYYGGDIAWVKSGELSQKLIIDTEEKITKAGLENSSAKIVNEGTILMAMYGATVGLVSVLGVRAATNQAVCCIEVKAEVNKQYLLAYLKTLKDYLLANRVGGAQPNLNQNFIKNLKIPLPPLAEQQRIAALLDTADRILKQRESAIAKLDQLAQSVFVDMFSNDTKYECEEVTLGDCLRFINGRAYSQNELLDAGTPVIRIQNLNGGDRWYYSNLNLPENKYCDYGDLLFAWSASFGPYIWNGKKSIYHYHIWKIETTKKIDKTFAFYLLQSITQKIRNASHGASMLHMTKSGMEAWKIKLPSLAYQMKFVDFINQLQPIETAYKKSLQLMTDNTRSIQHQSFAVN